MPRDVGLYLEDMLEAARRIAHYTGGLDVGDDVRLRDLHLSPTA